MRDGAITRRQALAGLGGGILAAPALVRADEPIPVRIVQQRGLLYLPVDVMVQGGLIAKHAAKRGIAVAASSQVVNSVATVNDALLSRSADLGTSGPPPLLTIWGRTQGKSNEIRAYGTMCNVPMTLYTIDPAIKTIRDFKPGDRIAVPAVKVSFNAIMLEMAAEKAFGDADRLDPLTVSMGHPDAIAALSGGLARSPIVAHVAVPPFTQQGLRLPGAHVVLDSQQVFGGPFTQMTLCGPRFENPKLAAVVVDALGEAIATINADKRQAVTLWKDVHKAPESIDQLFEIVSDPRFNFTSTPLRIGFLADFLYRQKRVPRPATSWKDIFWEAAWDRQGS